MNNENKWERKTKQIFILVSIDPHVCVCECVILLFMHIAIKNEIEHHNLFICVCVYIFFGGRNCQKEYNIYIRGGNFSYLVRRKARTCEREGEKEKEKECGRDEKMETNYSSTENQNSEHHFRTEKKNLSPKTFWYLFGVPLKLILFRIPSTVSRGKSIVNG